MKTERMEQAPALLMILVGACGVEAARLSDDGFEERSPYRNQPTSESPTEPSRRDVYRGAGTSDAGAASSGGAPDAGPSGTPLRCAPIDVSNVPARPPFKLPRPKQTTCAGADLATWSAQCDTNPVNVQACNRWKQANTACTQCIYSNESDDRWGPLYLTGTRGLLINDTGCFDYHASGCGDPSAVAQKCMDDACGAPCKDYPDEDYIKCLVVARTTVCAAAARLEESKCPGLDYVWPYEDPVSRVCTMQPTDTNPSWGLRIVKLFCGG